MITHPVDPLAMRDLIGFRVVGFGRYAEGGGVARGAVQGQIRGYVWTGKVLCAKRGRRKGLSDEIVGREEQNPIEFRRGDGTMGLPVNALI